MQIFKRSVNCSVAVASLRLSFCMAIKNIN